MHLINNGVPCGTVASSLMKWIKESENYFFQYPLHDDREIFKWQKHWMVFAALLLVSEEKMSFGWICMEYWSHQFRKPAWSRRVLHHPISLGLGTRRPRLVCYSKNHFMSTLGVVRELVCIYSVVRKAGMHCGRGTVEQRDFASLLPWGIEYSISLRGFSPSFSSYSRRTW